MLETTLECAVPTSTPIKHRARSKTEVSPSAKRKIQTNLAKPTALWAPQPANPSATSTTRWGLLDDLQVVKSRGFPCCTRGNKNQIATKCNQISRTSNQEPTSICNPKPPGRGDVVNYPPWWCHHVTAGTVSSGSRRSPSDRTDIAAARNTAAVGV